VRSSHPTDTGADRPTASSSANVSGRRRRRNARRHGGVRSTGARDDVTTLTITVEVRDPDGDAVSLRASGCTIGTDVLIPVVNGVATISFVPDASCSWSTSLTATDSRGAVAEVTVPIQHTRFRGWYRLVIGTGFYDTPSYSVNLEQSGTAITGTIRDTRGHSGTVDPHQPGTIDAEGRFHLRFKIQSEEDLEISGRIISPDRSVFDDVVIATGVVTSGGLAGRTLRVWREAQY